MRARDGDTGLHAGAWKRVKRGAILFAAGILSVLSGCGFLASGDGDSWKNAPVIPEFSGALEAQFLGDVEAADAAGHNPQVFAKVGDSNTELRGNLYGFGCRLVEYGEHGDLEPVVERYNKTTFDLAGKPGCEPVTSFSRFSAATRSGSFSTFPVRKLSEARAPFGSPDRACRPEETALACEIRLIRPRYTIIMTGTNDLGLDRSLPGLTPGSRTAERLALVIERTRKAGSVPVLSNLPPMAVPDTPTFDEDEAVETANAEIASLADELRVPLINLWGALHDDQMIDRGLGPDGVHLSVFGGRRSPELFENSVNLSDKALRYGANRRNFVWLETLNRLDRVAGGR